MRMQVRWNCRCIQLGRAPPQRSYAVSSPNIVIAICARRRQVLAVLELLVLLLLLVLVGVLVGLKEEINLKFVYKFHICGILFKFYHLVAITLTGLSAGQRRRGG